MSLAINGLTISNTDFNENKKIQEDEIKEFNKKLSRIDYFTIRDNNQAASQELDKIIPKKQSSLPL